MRRKKHHSDTSNVVTESQGRLDGKVAIIAGAGSVGPGWGNGRAIAVVFAKQGAKVFAVDVDATAMDETQKLIEEFRGVIVPYQADVTNSTSVIGMFKACLKQFRRIDILINNVGGPASGGPVEMDEELWDAQIDLNLKSVFLGCKYALPTMMAQGGGVIINIASTSAIRWNGAAQVAYAAAKAAVIQLSRVVAVQYAGHGIRVNTVVPGKLHTPLFVQARLAGPHPDEHAAAILEQHMKRVPLGFLGDGRDTAHAALFLASDEARYITGAEIVVDGGMSIRSD